MEELKPISKKELSEMVRADFPTFVIEAFNDELVLVGLGKTNAPITIRQDDVITRILKSKQSVTRAQIFANKWLDIEDYYMEYGWKVVYNKPAYHETFAAHWVFS